MKYAPFSISIFFPAYNEESNIRETIRAMRESVRTLTDTYELIIVNDGSNDKTGTIAEELKKADPQHIKVVHHVTNLGYGSALMSGISAATYDWVFFTDADLQFDPYELRLLTQHIRDYPVIIGYRAKRRDPFMRLVNAKGWNILNRLLFKLKVKDIDCAFKLFKRELVADLPLQSKGAMLSAEILIRLRRKQVNWKEVPVTHLPRKQGSPTGAKLSVIFKALQEMHILYVGELGNRSIVEFFKFSFIGVINTTIDVGLYFILTRFSFMDNIILVKGITYFTGTMFSFFANRFWTFSKYSTINMLEVGRFYAAGAIALSINISAMYVLTKIFSVHDGIAVFIATIITIGWSFTSMKFWVYSSTTTVNKEKIPLYRTTQ